MEILDRDHILQALDEDIDEEIWDGNSSDESDEGDHDDNVENFNTDTEQSSLSDDDHNTFFDDDVRSTYSYHTSEDDLPLSVRASSFFYGKNGTQRNRRPSNQRVRTAVQNHVTENSRYCKKCRYNFGFLAPFFYFK